MTSKAQRRADLHQLHTAKLVEARMLNVYIGDLEDLRKLSRTNVHLLQRFINLARKKP